MKILLLLLLTCTVLSANPDQFRELFADPATRQEALGMLTPGTESYYFHTALDHQLEGRSKQYQTTIQAWIAASKQKKNRIGTNGLETLEMRRILKRYETDPNQALEEIADAWALFFDDTKPDSAAEEQSLPTSIDPSLISSKAFRQEQVKRYPHRDYQHYSQAALYEELDQLNTFTPEGIHWYAQHFDLTHHPKYVDLLVKALNQKPQLHTSDIPLKKLTLEQMDKLRAKQPTMASSELFNEHYLAKLRPTLPLRLERDPQAHAAYLAACWEHVKKLPASQISLKAFILHHHLRLQQQLGNHPEAEFFAYLEMPRQHHLWIRPTKKAEHYCSFSQRLNTITDCPVISNDFALVESYLEHFLAKADKIDPKLSKLINKEELERLHARARILAGANPKTHVSALGAHAYRELREEIRIDFAPTVRREFQSADEVTLPILLKNTPTLLVRIYELQGHTTQEARSADIDLDGLVPHHTRTLEFEQDPVIQHQHELALPELEGAGSWIVELVSQSISARALIRKGIITPYITRTAEGQEVRLFDESNQSVDAFTIELGSESFEAKDGICFIPNAANSARNRGLIIAGKLGSPVQLGSRAQRIQLQTRFLLDQEQLLAGEKAKLRLRNQLTNHGQPIDLGQLEDATLVMKAELMGGVTTERVVTDAIRLAPTNELEFLVPENLLSLTLHLSATARSDAEPQPITLNQSQTYKLNKALQTARIGMALFSPTDRGTILELRGRNGEPLANHPVILMFKHVDYAAGLSVKARTDDKGQIQLGDLSAISRVTASSSSMGITTHEPFSHHTEIATDYRVCDDEEIRIPALRPHMGGASLKPTLHRLVRIGSQSTTVSEELQAALELENGFISISALKPGLYRLQQQGAVSTIEVLPAATRKGDLIVTEERILPHSKPASPMITGIKTDEETVTLQLAGASEHTRVSIIGKRYLASDWVDGSAVHPFDLSAGPQVTRATRPAAFITSRRISDEMRYIIERRNAKQLPGVMLPRPGQLLYRWTPQNLEQGDLDSEGEGEGYGFGSAGSDFSSSPSKTRRRDSTHDEDPFLAIDFLARPSSIEFDLKPDAEGRIKIPSANFKGAQFLHIIASDLKASDERIIAFKPTLPTLRDRSLTRPLAAKSHHIATRSAASLAPGAQAEIRNLLDADWRAFTTLEQAHQFLLGSMGDDTLRRFLFLSKWPELKAEEKLQLLADHHCHELHLFIQRKDRAFFDKHIRSILAAKPLPQFMDDYLLERDLSKYLEIHAFAQLNAAEKALLAQAMPDSRKAIARELELRWQSEAPSAEAQTVLFTKTLKGADLDNVDSLGMAYLRGLRKANELLAKAESHYQLGYYDKAKLAYEEVLGIDAYNVSARRGLERLAAVKSDYQRAAYDHTRMELLSDVDEAWEMAVPKSALARSIVTSGNRSGDFTTTGNSIDAILSNTIRGGGGGGAPFASEPILASEGHQHGIPLINEKLRRIKVNLNFQDTSVEDAIEFLRMRASELDSLELDPNKKGINFVVRGGGSHGMDAGLDSALGGSSPGEKRIEELRLRNVPLEVALQYICEAADLRYRVDNHAVTLVPQTDTGEEILTRTFTVPPDFRDSISYGASDIGDPFAPPSGQDGISSLPPIEELLKKSGISFPKGASATLVGNKLLVASTPTELEKIEQLTSNMSISAPELGDLPNIGGLFTMQDRAPQFVDQTRSWLESNYYKHRGRTGEELIPLNRFWLELAAWNGEGPFTSPHFNNCTASGSDALMCLALLDLPFSAEAPEVSVEEQSLKIKARAPMLLFYKDTRETDQIAADSPLLVRQSYHPLGEPFRTVNGKQVENTHVGDFRTGTAYGLSLVITNPSGIERRIETLAQIPAGSIPLTPSTGKGGIGRDAPTTLSTTHRLEPFGVIQLQLAFYFPSAGEFMAYPLHVAEDGTILAHAEPRALRVVDEPAPEDSASWSVLARDGSSEAVLNRLKQGDPAQINLSAILWRLQDKKFFSEVVAILRERLWDSDDVHQVFAYGIHHNDADAIADWLELKQIGSHLGHWFDSELIRVTPASHHGWELIEFDPLINPRAHPFGDQASFTHDDAHEFYQDFLDGLAWKARLSDSDQMTYTCLLLLQDRHEEAIKRFSKINPEGLTERLQYDYLKSVVLFLREQPEEARAIAEVRAAELPPGTWKERFEAVLQQSDEIRKPVVTAAEDKTAEFSSLAVLQDPEKANHLLIKHRNLEDVEISLFHIDLEIVFSKDPFLSGGMETSVPSIEPNLVAQVNLDEEASSTSYQLPDAFRKGNILVAAESGRFKQLKIMDSQAIDMQVNPTHRSLQVFATEDNQVLPKTYVKVYRELDDGRIEYHKDGYTDLRGKFDYLSHTGENLSNIKRLAILVSHPEKGARTTIIRR